MNKPHWVLLIALIVAGAVLVAGCTSPLSNNASLTPSTATSQRANNTTRFLRSLYHRFMESLRTTQPSTRGT